MMFVQRVVLPGNAVPAEAEKIREANGAKR